MVNPKSGKGKADSVYKESLDWLTSTGFLVTKFMTERRNHAHDHIKSMPKEELQSYSGVITISGDGLPHEVINGFYSREDSSEINFRMGCLPGGTGCALMFCMLKERNLDFTLENAVYLLSRKSRQKMDINEFTIKKVDDQIHTVYGFLNFLWGYTSDVDIDSEGMRWMGDLRFDVYGAYKVVGKTKRKCKWTNDPESDLPALDEEILDENWSTFEGDCHNITSQNLEYISKDYRSAPGLKFNDKKNFFSLVPGTVKWRHFVGYLLNHASGKYLDKAEARGIHIGNLVKFRLEVQDKNIGYLDIDGEAYKGKAIQSQLSDKQIDVFY